MKSLIQQKVSTLFVAPNDPDSMAPVLSAGMLSAATAPKTLSPGAAADGEADPPAI